MPQIKAYDQIKMKASVEDVWNVLIDISSYHKWWLSIVQLKILNSPNEIIGNKFQANPMGGKIFEIKK